MIDTTKSVSRITYNGVDIPLKPPLQISLVDLINEGYKFGGSEIYQFDISGEITRSDLNNLFSNCIATGYINFSDVTIPENTNINSMFNNCQNIFELNGFGEIMKSGKVQNIGNLFDNCYNVNFSNLDIENWDTANVVYMNYTFRYTYGAINSMPVINISNWDMSNAIDCEGMFSNSGFREVFAENMNIPKVTKMTEMFSFASNLTSVSFKNTQVPNLANMQNMFYLCSSLSSVDFSNFKTSKVTNMHGLFYGCNSMTEIDISSFDTSRCPTIENMFLDCSNLQSIKLPTTIPNITDSSLAYTTNLTNLFVPKGTLNAYQQHSVWGQHSDKMSEYALPNTTYIFNTDGGTPVGSITQDSAIPETPITTPNDTNKKFVGWFLDSEFKIPVGFPFGNTDSSISTINLYARYAEPDGSSQELAFTIDDNNLNKALPIFKITEENQVPQGAGYEYPSVWLEITPTVSGEYMITDAFAKVGDGEFNYTQETPIMIYDDTYSTDYCWWQTNYSWEKFTLEAGKRYRIAVNFGANYPCDFKFVMANKIGKTSDNARVIQQADVGVTTFTDYVCNLCESTHTYDALGVYFEFTPEESGDYFLDNIVTPLAGGVGISISKYNTTENGYYYDNAVTDNQAFSLTQGERYLIGVSLRYTQYGDVGSVSFMLKKQ